MRVIATLAKVEGSKVTKVMAISPGDNIYYVDLDDATDEMKAEAAELCRGTPSEVLGFIIEGATSHD